MTNADMVAASFLFYEEGGWVDGVIHMISTLS